MPDGKDCQLLARASVSEQAEISMLIKGAEAGLPDGEVQDKVGGPSMISE